MQDSLNLQSKLTAPNQPDTVLRAENVDIYYGKYRAVQGATLNVPKNSVVAFIGPSGCGKSTVLRCFNRLNDLVESFSLTGKITYHGANLYDRDIDAVEVRKRIGMVFQRPNPFPKSIYDNIVYGARVQNYSKGQFDELVESSLRRSALWDEVKDKLQESGFSLSGGQQQRLCIARAIAAQPDVLLMDEPCSALDPISTLKVEELIHELKQNYTIVIVTHNMQQAARVADYTAFYNAQVTDGGGKVGLLVEYDQTGAIFGNPREKTTQDYVAGRFG
jgi:phosphate transport system ATP-binding protein